MMRFWVEAVNLARTRDRWGRFAGRARPEVLIPAAQTMADKMLNIARDEAPRLSGDLRDSLHLVRSGDMAWGLTSNLPYEKYVRKGTESHPIWGGYYSIKHIGHTRSKNPKMAVYWQGALHPYYVVHHGNKPNPYDKRTAARMEAEIERMGKIIYAQFKVGIEG